MTFDWVNITPTFGSAGKTILALSVNSKNLGAERRQMQFNVKSPDGVTRAVLTITQERGARDFSLDFSLDFG